ncbi:MAG: hypothetical protein AB7U18_29390, partial [Dehalococcoidia bacterium]
MTPLELLVRLVTAIEVLPGLLRQVVAVGALVTRHLPVRPAAAYETVSLDLVLDIRDAEGHRAILTRRQRVRALTGEPVTVRELVWGEGTPLAHYRVRGASRLTIVPEGSRAAVLLCLFSGDSARRINTIESRRLIRNGLRKRHEYCEALVERPTGRLAMRVVFPGTRPPKRAEL